MDFTKQNPARLLTILLISALVLLLLLLASVNFIVPFYTSKALKSVSQKKNVEISAERSTFSLFNGLSIKGLKLSGNGKETLNVKKVLIKPDYLSSLKERKLIFKSLNLKKSHINISKGSTDNILQLFKSDKEGEKSAENGESNLQIRKIKADDLIIDTGKTTKLNFQNLEVNWNQDESDKHIFGIKTDFSFNGNETSAAEGELKLSSEKKYADLVLRIAGISKLYGGNSLKIPEDLTAKVRSRFDFPSEIETKTKFSFFRENSKEIGELNLNLIYGDGDLTIKKSTLGFKNFINMNLRGRIEDVLNRKVVSISSKMEIEDLNSICEWTNFISENELTGNLKSEGIKIEGSGAEKNLHLLAKGKLRDVNYKTDKYSFNKVNSDFKFDYKIFENEGGVDLNLTSSNNIITVSDDTNVTIEKLHTPQRAEIGISKGEQGELIINGKGISLEKPVYPDYSLNKAEIRDFQFTRDQDQGFTLKADIAGNEFRSGSNVSIKNLNAELKVQTNGKEVTTTGNIDLNKGNINSYKIDEFRGDFKLLKNGIELRDSKINADYIESAEVKNVFVRLPEEGKSMILIDLNGAVISALDRKIKSDVKSADFQFDAKSSDLNGKIDADSLEYNGKEIKNLDFHLSYRDSKLGIEKLNSNLQGGQLMGRGWIDLKTSPYNFNTTLEVKGFNIGSEKENYRVKKLSASAAGKLIDDNIDGNGEIILEEMEIGDSFASSKVNGNADLLFKGETIFVNNGFINNGNSKNIDFKGEIVDYTGNNRRAQLDINETELSTLKEVFYPLLPFEVQEGELTGTVKSDFGMEQDVSGFDWNGKLSIKDAGIDTLFSLTEFRVEGINGVITLNKSVVSKNPLSEVIGRNLKINRDVYTDYLNSLEKNREKNTDTDYLKIKKVIYGFFNIEDIETNFEMNHSKVNLNYIKCNIYDGKILGTGVYNLKQQKYNMSVLFNNISLTSISNSIPSIRDYITGRVNGMMWINDGKNLGSIDGLFSLWAIESDEEQRYIGRALLEQIGATGRFFTGASRRYDKGIISGYIKEGFMTFKELEISNTFLGYKDLKILVDEKKNSISVKQLLSVIKEIAKRASSGDIKLDFEKKRK